MSKPQSGDLPRAAGDFAANTARLLVESLPHAPGIELQYLGERAKIRPAGQTDKSGGVPLFGEGERLAWLRLDYLCKLDSSAEFLAIDRAKIWIVADVDSTPIFRFDYLYDADWVPHSHIQVHAERGALSHLLSKTGHTKPHNLSALHLPTGGARFRPVLEDIIQFLIVDCGFESNTGWRQAVLRERAEWRRVQTRTVARAWPEEAATQLTDMGYRIEPPVGGHPEPHPKALEAW